MACSRASRRQPSAEGAELRDVCMCCNAFGATGAEGADAELMLGNGHDEAE